MVTRVDWVGLVWICAALGCGGTSTSDPNGSGGSGAGAGSGGSGAISGSGGSANAGSGGAAVGGSSGSGGSSGGTAGSGGMSCADFADQAPPPQGVTLRVHNSRSTPIYLGGDNNCAPTKLYTLSGPGGLVQHYAGGCGNSCAELQQHEDWCTDACYVPPVIRIDPGGSYDTSWAGTTFENSNMPKECYFDPIYAPPTCDRQIVAPAGKYAASIVAFSDVTCLDVGICPCLTDGSGSCEIPYGAMPSGQQLPAEAVFAYPSESLVVIDVL